MHLNSRYLLSVMIHQIYPLQGNITDVEENSLVWSLYSTLCLCPVAECGSTVSNSEGVLLSPNYPLNYDNSHECVYSIQVETGKGINVSASTFQLAQGDILKVITPFFHSLSSLSLSRSFSSCILPLLSFIDSVYYIRGRFWVCLLHLQKIQKQFCSWDQFGMKYVVASK